MTKLVHESNFCLIHSTRFTTDQRISLVSLLTYIARNQIFDVTGQVEQGCQAGCSSHVVEDTHEVAGRADQET